MRRRPGAFATRTCTRDRSGARKASLALEREVQTMLLGQSDREPRDVRPGDPLRCLSGLGVVRGRSPRRLGSGRCASSDKIFPESMPELPSDRVRVVVAGHDGVVGSFVASAGHKRGHRPSRSCGPWETGEPLSSIFMDSAGRRSRSLHGRFQPRASMLQTSATEPLSTTSMRSWRLAHAQAWFGTTRSRSPSGIPIGSADVTIACSS